MTAFFRIIWFTIWFFSKIQIAQQPPSFLKLAHIYSLLCGDSLNCVNVLLLSVSVVELFTSLLTVTAEWFLNAFQRHKSRRKSSQLIRCLPANWYLVSALQILLTLLCATIMDIEMVYGRSVCQGQVTMSLVLPPQVSKISNIWPERIYIYIWRNYHLDVSRTQIWRKNKYICLQEDHFEMDRKSNICIWRNDHFDHEARLICI